MLTTKRPTQTTVLFTVSTRCPATTLAAKLTGHGLTLLRLAIGLFISAILVHELHNASNFPSLHALAYIDSILWPSSLGWFARSTIYQLPALWRAGFCAAATWLIFRRGYTEESLLVVRGLGVQTSTSSPSYLWASSTRFIPTSSLQDIFIHEAFKGFQVRFYLSIVVEGEEDVVVVFPNILPRREILEQVWRGAKACLYEPQT